MVEADAKDLPHGLWVAGLADVCENERLAALSETPPLAVICIKSKEQLRWYVPVTAQMEPNQDVPAQDWNDYHLESEP
ncbi:unnamed protein product [Symbiodinium sp. CCMP2456]|nr:unnamed protein product [Symbiodinium sp. CCMP2456]